MNEFAKTFEVKITANEGYKYTRFVSSAEPHGKFTISGKPAKVDETMLAMGKWLEFCQGLHHETKFWH